MAGTVIGFIMMLSGFAKVDVTDTSTVQGLIKSLGVGMSTALYSTLTGLICSALLKIQYFNLTQSIFRAKKK
jgi:biopolymer transport protein ExbB/TolQ